MLILKLSEDLSRPTFAFSIHLCFDWWRLSNSLLQHIFRKNARYSYRTDLKNCYRPILLPVENNKCISRELGGGGGGGVGYTA